MKFIIFRWLIQGSVTPASIFFIIRSNLCVKLIFECPFEPNSIFIMTCRCFPSIDLNEGFESIDCLSILSPVKDNRGGDGIYQRFNECLHTFVNYTTRFIQDHGLVIRWECRELIGKQKGWHSERAWILGQPRSRELIHR